MSGSDLTNKLVAAGMAWLPASLLGDTIGTVISVLDYGALGDGFHDDTAAIQAAAASLSTTGGTLFFPTGTYLVSSPTLLASNVTVQGAGNSSLIVGVSAARWVDQHKIGNDPYAFFSNSNYGGALIDHDITVQNMAFSWINNQQGSAHCVRFYGAQNVTVQNCHMIYGGDAVTGLSCSNFLVIGCSSYEAMNCPWDFFGSNNDVMVIGCHAQSSLLLAQICCFNAYLGLQGPPGQAQTAVGFKLIGCTFVNTSATINTGSCSLDTLATNCTVRDVTIDDCTFTNCFVHGNGDVQDVTVTNCRFYDIPGQSAIYCFTDGVMTPSHWTVVDNQIIDPQTVVGNSGVIRIWANGYLIAGNTISGTSFAVACSTSTFVGVLGVNNFAPGTVTTITGTAAVATTIQFAMPNNIPTQYIDLSGTAVEIFVDSANTFYIKGTDNAGSVYNILSMVQRATGAGLHIYPVTDINQQSANYLRLQGGASGANPVAAPLYTVSPNSIDTDVAVRFTGKGIRGGLVGVTTLSGAPSTTDIPAGYMGIVKNTGDSTVKLYYNDGGSLKSVALA